MLKFVLKNGSMGFSMIELMVGIVILGLLATMAIPSFQVWIENTQIRSSAESIKSGIQRARSEAVARNAQVQFVLGAGLNWSVIEIGGVSNPIDARSRDEGSAHITVAPLPGGGASMITFNNLGGVVATNADGSAPLAGVAIDSSSLSAAQSQDLQVTIGVGGNVRMCDPNAPTGSARRC